MELTQLRAFVFVFYSFILSVACDDFSNQIDDTPTSVSRGFFKREHSLIKPYQAAAMEIPYWNIVGNVIVSHEQIRLTRDQQSQKGAVWNRVPCTSRDWEIIVHFNVHGSTGNLFGDGFAIWYAQDPNILGDIFGSKDFFRGLAIFMDTYSNHNGPHTHSHPFISAMVNNGSLHYDHDRDGTHTQLGGEHTGCEAKFRNKEFDSQVLIRYVGETLSVFTDISGLGKWKQCLKVDGVRLPTHYFFGVSAATGDLSDNHDVISIKMFEQEYSRAERPFETSPEKIEPFAEHFSAPRDHIEDKRPSKLGWIGTIVLVIVGIVIVIGVLGFGVFFFQQRQERSRKRFY